MRETVIKRGLALFFVLAMAVGALGVLAPIRASAETTEAKAVSRMINVVYDDSNSMLLDNRLWWCYAKYSLEVFSAMMQDNDVMNIYYMSAHMPDADPNAAPGIPNLSGDRAGQQKNINTIHNYVTKTRGTPFASIKKAYSDLKSVSGYDEKWLVVITDGDSFDGGENSATIDKQIADCNSYGVKVVYLAIGSAMVPTENTSKGIFVYKADGNVSKGNDGILANVTRICQRIFQRPALTTATGSQLVLDIPVSEIIVFAQGANVNIGEINGTKKIQSSVQMKESDKNKATTNEKYKDSINIANLNAAVATFTPKTGRYISEGTYDLSVSADEYVVYYKPCLDVVLELIDGKGNKVSDKYIPIGSYTLQYWLTYPQGHPKHGEKIDQSLFDVEYTLTCNVDGSVRNLNSLNVDLSEGETTIRVLAEYLNFSSSDAALKYVVENFTVNELKLELEYLQQEYRLSTLESDNAGILVKVSKGEQPIPAAEWEAFKIACGVDNPEFKTVKNADSSFTVYPQYKNGKKTDTATGDIEFSITVSASNDHRTTDSGTVNAKINIYDDVNAAPIGITIAEQGVELDNKNFATQNSDRKVTIDWNGQPLTPEQYEALKLAVEINDKDYAATIVLDPYVPGQPTTATVHFELVPDKEGAPPAPKKLHGTKNITVTAEIENEGQRSEGEAKAKMKVTDARTWLERWTWLIILILCIIILLLYMPPIKKWLPFKKTYYMYGVYSKGVSELKWYKKVNIFTVIFPIVAVRSSVSLDSVRMPITLDVKARGGKNVRITNADTLANTYLFDGKTPGKKNYSIYKLSITTKQNGAFVAKLQKNSTVSVDTADLF